MALVSYADGSTPDTNAAALESDFVAVRDNGTRWIFKFY